MVSSLKLFVFLLLLSGSLAAIIDSPYIFGGEKASENQFPFLVSLRVYGKWSYDHICAASILSDRFLVTAAHCCSHFSRPHVHQISIGAHTKVSEGDIYSVQQFFVHPNYTAMPFSKLENDIALIELKKSIKFGQNVSTIEISREFFEGNADAIVAGWGKTEVCCVHSFFKCKFKNLFSIG